jgi:predicted DNA-binding transcriptional regulator AlpA
MPHGAIAILRLPAVCDRTGLKRATIYQKIREGCFPDKVKLGARASGWISSEVDAWVEQRVTESRGARS